MPHGGYRKLRSFRVAEAVYDLMVVFCDRFIDKRSRTHDQTVQAARSGARNIAEGSVASGTSKKIELKLTGIAEGSLEELLLDYESFLRQRRLRVWDKNSREAMEARGRFKADSDESDGLDGSDEYGMEIASAEVAGNTMVCLVNQALYLVRRQMDALEKAYLAEGGFTERMYRQRRERRGF